MTAHLPTTLLTLLIASPLLILLAYVGIGAWLEASDRVDEGLRIPGSDDQLCTCCTRYVATQPYPDKSPAGSVCIHCYMGQPCGNCNCQYPAVVAGGVRSLCVSCGEPDDDLLAHPDGGAGGVCTDCLTRLLPKGDQV